MEIIYPSTAMIMAMVLLSIGHKMFFTTGLSFSLKIPSQGIEQKLIFIVLLEVIQVKQEPVFIL